MKPSTMYVIGCIVWSLSIVCLAAYLAVTWDMWLPLLLLIFTPAYNHYNHMELLREENKNAKN